MTGSTTSSALYRVTKLMIEDGNMVAHFVPWDEKNDSLTIEFQKIYPPGNKNIPVIGQKFTVTLTVSPEVPE